MTTAAPARLWLVAASLLVAAAVLTGISHLLFWWPCAGAGSASETCASRSATWLSPPFLADPGDRVPGVAVTAALASLLAALAWPFALLGSRMPRGIRIVGVIAALQPLSLGIWSVVSAVTPWIDPATSVSPLWWVAGELVAIALLIVFVSVDGDDTPGRGWLATVLVGATTFGMLRWMAELTLFGGTVGDGQPLPWAGSGLAATLLVCGVLVLLRARQLRVIASQSRESAILRKEDEPQDLLC